MCQILKHLRLTIALLFTVLMGLCCSCSKTTQQENIFAFDPLKDYPEFPLSLNDVAEVSYVKLGGEEEGVFFQNVWSTGVSIDPAKEYLFYGSSTSAGIIVFDIHGKFLRRLGHFGRGPGEYMTPFFCIYPEKEQVWIYDVIKKRFLVFKYDGTFLEDERMNVDIYPGFFNFLVYDDCLVAYTPESTTYFEALDRTVRREKTLELFPLDKLDKRTIQDLHYEKTRIAPRNWPGRTIMVAGHLFPSYSGLMMTTYRSDTTYVIEKDFVWRPFLVNEKHNGVQEGCLYPAGETKDYLFLCHQNNLKDGDIFYFAIDKKTKQAYKITEDDSNPLPGPLQGKAQIRYRGIMKHPQYRFWEFDGVKLKNTCYDYLPPDLKTLVDQCDEESNPILMLIKFKE